MSSLGFRLGEQYSSQTVLTHAAGALVSFRNTTSDLSEELMVYGRAQVGGWLPGTLNLKISKPDYTSPRTASARYDRSRLHLSSDTDLCIAHALRFFAAVPELCTRPTLHHA